MVRLFLFVLLAVSLVSCRARRYRTSEEPVPDTAVYEGVPVQSLPPAPRPRERAVISATPPPSTQQIEAETSAPPRLSATPHVTTSAPAAAQFPTAKPVPGKPGFVYSPYDGA